MAEHGWLGPIEWAAKASARPGENICGDKLIAVDVEGTGALMGVLDGLGHGADHLHALVGGFHHLERNFNRLPGGFIDGICAKYFFFFS